MFLVLKLLLQYRQNKILVIKFIIGVHAQKMGNREVDCKLYVICL